MRCPGQDMRNLRVSLHKCPNCGHEVEIFSDETRARCSRCGTRVYKEETPSCVNWCAHARECLGEERWKMLHDEGEIQDKKSDLEDTDQKQKVI